jgi:hypothetical protein
MSLGTGSEDDRYYLKRRIVEKILRVKQVGGDSIKSRWSNMRKLDYLRKYYRKALKVGTDAIYGIELPKGFFKKGDEGVWAHPYSDKGGLLGVVLEHNYMVDDQWYSWEEYFPMRKIVC